MQDLTFDDLMPSPQSQSVSGGMSDLSFDDLMPVKPQVGYGEDIAKGALSGVGRGVAAIPGFAGDVQNLARMAPWAPKRSLLDAILEQAGFSRNLPTSSDTINAAARVVPGLDYRPQTAVGRMAQDVGEFVPGALTGGEGTVARRIAMNAVAPGVGESALGQLTEGSSYEPAARIVGAIAGAGVPRAVGGAYRAVKPPVVPAAPTTEELRKSAGDAYTAFTQDGGRFTKPAISELQWRINDKLTDIGWEHDIAPQVSAVTKRLDDILQGPGLPTASGAETITPQQILNLRKLAGNLRGSSDRTTKMFGHNIVGEIDDFLGNLPDGAYIGGSGNVGETLKNANRLYQTFRQSEAVDQALEKAGRRIAKGQPVEVATTGELTTLMNRKNNPLNPDQKKLVDEYLAGDKIRSVLRAVGRASPDTSIGGAIAVGGTAFGSPHSIPVALAGYLARGAADKRARAQAERLAAEIRNGGKRSTPAPTQMRLTPSQAQLLDYVRQIGMAGTATQTQPYRGLLAPSY